MSFRTGSYRLGPENATLSVRTERSGAAAKAGHDLVIHVTAWEALLEVADDPGGTGMQLTADPGSLRVITGTGGMQALGDDDVASINKTIDEEVLGRQEIRFRSTAVEADGDTLRARGDLTLVGNTRPIEFDLAAGEGGAVNGTAVVTQTAFGMKPYSALFGALKVTDEVQVVLEGHLEPQSR
ncbi:MAG TPA: YceI family protein [Thermoleophilaceae bacterium]|nr:YceI family protein [Thermoleophilaceae bacterium]